MRRDEFIRAMPFVVILWSEEEQGSSVQRPGGSHAGMIKIENDPDGVHPWLDASRLLHSVETRVKRIPAMIHHSAMSLDAAQVRAVVEAEFLRDTTLGLADRVDKSFDEVKVDLVSV